MNVKRLLLVGGLGLVALIGFFQLQNMSAPAPAKKAVRAAISEVISTVKYVDVLMATQDIAMGTRLNSELMEWQKWPEEAMNDNLIDNITHPKALQKFSRAVTRTAIYEGEPILHKKVVHSGERGPMASLLRAGMRGISTRINVESAAGGFIHPGDRVDVILTTRSQANAGPNKAYISETIFENVKVLAIGKTARSGQGTTYVAGSTALLELSQSDAEILIEAQSKGNLSLTLRGLNRRAAMSVSSSATSERQKTDEVISMKIYRSGQPQQVAIQGQ